jgi:hypothetical protein
MFFNVFHCNLWQQDLPIEVPIKTPTFKNRTTFEPKDGNFQLFSRVAFQESLLLGCVHWHGKKKLELLSSKNTII